MADERPMHADDLRRMLPSELRAEQDAADAELGAALREALATLSPDGLLSIAPLDLQPTERIWLVNGGTGPAERPEDKRLAALLTRSATQETKT